VLDFCFSVSLRVGEVKALGSLEPTTVVGGKTTGAFEPSSAKTEKVNTKTQEDATNVEQHFMRAIEHTVGQISVLNTRYLPRMSYEIHPNFLQGYEE